MKKLVHSIITLALVAFLLSACASVPRHEKYRAKEHATHAVIVPFEIDPNEIKSMEPEEFDEFMRRLKVYNQFVRDTGYASAYQAYAEMQWVKDPESGPPSTPEGWNDTKSYTSPRPGVFGDSKSAAMRAEADRLWLRVEEMLKPKE